MLELVQRCRPRHKLTQRQLTVVPFFGSVFEETEEWYNKLPKEDKKVIVSKFGSLGRVKWMSLWDFICVSIYPFFRQACLDWYHSKPGSKQLVNTVSKEVTDKMDKHLLLSLKMALSLKDQKISSTEFLKLCRVNNKI